MTKKLSSAAAITDSDRLHFFSVLKNKPLSCAQPQPQATEQLATMPDKM